MFYSSLVAPVLFLTARQILAGRNHETALLVAGAWVVYPPSIWYSSWILTETTSALLVVASLGAFLWATKSGRVWPALLTGALWAILSLNRPVFLLLPLALPVAQFVLFRIGPLQWRWSFRKWALGISAFVLVMAPWTVRNYIEHGVFMPHSTQGGYALLLTNGSLWHPDTRAGGYYKNPVLLYLRTEGDTEVERDASRRKLALEEMRRHWRLLPVAMVNRARNFWTTRPDPRDPTWTRNDWAMLLVWGPVLAFFLASGFLVSWRHFWPALILILYTFLLTVPFWGAPRFRYPVDALIVTVAAAGFVQSLAWLSSTMARRRRRLRGAATPDQMSAI